MQIRCFHCHKPYALGREAILNALQSMQAGEQGHYNASCPHCSRVNRVSQKELERAAPDWKAAVAAAQADVAAAQAPETPTGDS